MAKRAAVMRELADNPSKRRRMRCRRLTMYSTNPIDLRETSGPRIDRFPLARPPWPWAAGRPRIKKKEFSAPSTCPIDLFGPVANGTILKRLHAAFALASVLQDASFQLSHSTALCRLHPLAVSAWKVFACAAGPSHHSHHWQFPALRDSRAP